MKSSNQYAQDNTMSRSLAYQSPEEIEELLLQELENLFDKPCLVPVTQQTTESDKIGQQPGGASHSNHQPLGHPSQSATSFKVGFEKDYTNTFLITNPTAIFKVFSKDQFLLLSESSQCLLLDRLDDILQKCSHNSLILTDHVVLSNVTRLNQQAIAEIVNRNRKQEEEDDDQQLDNAPSMRQSTTKLYIPENDIIMLVIQLCLKLSNKKPATTKKLIDLIKKLTLGKRFLKCHIEYIYQYLKLKCQNLCKSGKSAEAMSKVDSSIRILINIFEQRFEVGPPNYFYFSGFLSGIQVNPKTIPQSEFIKGFTACMWFQVQDNNFQDDKNLPVLFNCFFQGYGGFECYFNQKKLFYRILPKVYTPPREFIAKKWYFFAIEHDKPSFTRPVFTAIINDKQIVNLPLDYPKIDKNAKISMIAICKNFVGQLSSFVLFKDAINNTKKIIQIYHSNENGFQQNFQNNQGAHTKNVSSHGSLQISEILDQKIIDKILILYTPERTSNKTVYDCIEMRDGELMINSGVCNNGPKSKLFFTGGLNSLLPLLDLIRAISLYKNEKNNMKQIDSTLNEFLRLINAVMSSKSVSNYESDLPVPFFNIMFHLLGNLPSHAVNDQTIHLLAEIRFQIGDSKMQEQFFQNLLQSSDFWLNTDNMDVINEFWSFVKAIYSQNPIQYNRIFSIQNLIDLMVKISDIKDAGHCCEYHRNTYMMFYQGQIQSQSYHRPSGGFITRDRKESQNIEEKQKNPFQEAITLKTTNNVQIHQVDKYLAPIAGVLEGVLTSGGNEVLDQIQYIAKSLTVKTSPCFHLQMLKLLKLLLLDSYSKEGDRHCASPGDFAAHFLKAKGLQILLYLCSNSSFDVKAMCVKLIDVLSSHTSLIKMAIDPDVITYLCNIVLPKSMIESAHLREKSQIFKNIGNDRMILGATDHQQNINQYEIMDEIEEMQDQDKSDSKEDSSDLEDHINQLLGQNHQIQKAPEILQKPTKQKKFGKGLFIEDEDEQLEINMKQNISKEKQLKSEQRLSIDGFQNEIQQLDPFEQKGYIDEDEQLLPGTRPPPPAPRSKGRPQLMFDFNDDDEDESSPQENKSKAKFNQTSKANIFGKKSNMIITEVTEEDDEEMKSQGDDQQDEVQLNKFGMLGFSKKNQQSTDQKKQFLNTQKLPSGKSGKSGFGFGKGLQLDIQGSDDEFDKRQKQNQATRNTFTVSTANKKPKTLQFEEVEEVAPIKNYNNSKQQIKEKPVSFANENVMSKSNLRQPKQFNFGFPDSDSEDESVFQSKEEEKEPQIMQTNEEIAEIYRQQQLQLEEDDLLFEQQIFQERQSNNKIEKEENELEQIIGNKKGNSVLAPSSSKQNDIQQRGRNNKFGGLGLTLGDDNDNESLELPKPQQQQKRNLVLGGNTGATSDTMFDEPNSRERQQQQQIEQQDEGLTLPRKKAVISYQKKARLFTNANNKLNIDTDAINELFTYGGEKGEVKMTEDEEMVNFENEIEELASMCLAAMNRKKPTDAIKYAQKNSKTAFESKYLGGGIRDDDDEEEEDSQQTSKDKKTLLNPRSQFMTPQSVRGIKKIELLMSQEEKNAELEATGPSVDKMYMGRSIGTSGLSTTKNFGLKSKIFAKNTILEETSPNSQSKSSNSKFEPTLGALSGGDPFSQKPQKNSNISLNKVKSKKSGNSNNNFNQTSPHIHLSEPLTKIISQVKGINNPRRNSDDFQELQSLIQEDMEFDKSKTTNDEYTSELENLYTSCLEWIISRAPSSLYENIVIDECDKIGYQPAIQLLITLVTYSNNIIRQRALNDLEMLAKWDSNNGTQIMMHPQFHQWLLELLMPYQDLTSKYQNLQGSSLAVYDIGCKLHTLLLKNACINAEEEAYKKINFLLRWPMIVQSQMNQGIKDRVERDVETANKLTRVLIVQLLNSLKEETCRIRPQIAKNMPIWQNTIYIIQLLEELMLTSNSEDFSSEIDSIRDVNVSLFKWVQKDYLLYYNGSNEKSLWAEWDVSEQAFLLVDGLIPEFIMKTLKSNSILSDEQVYGLLEKCSADEFNSIIDILMHEGSPYKTQQGSTAAGGQFSVPKQSQQTKAKALLTGVLGGSKQQQPVSDISQNQQMNINSENSFLKSILNMICVILSQADTKILVQHWLDRFERIIKFAMIVSETWKSRLVSSVYSNYQKKISDIISFAFTFLFHQIHQNSTSPNRQNYILGQYNQMPSNTSSPKEQYFNKLYAQSLKNLMIFLINIVEYSKMRYTPSQLESHVTACRIIFYNILVKNYTNQQGLVVVDNLIPINDIQKLKQTDYDDFPECFYWEDWKVTFFYSETIKRVVKKQINPQMLQSFLQKRKSFAQHYLESQISNEKTKDDILKRMQCDTVEIIGQISEEEFERKNKVALMNDNFIREQGSYWNKTKKDLFGVRGVWRFAISGEGAYLKANLYKSNDGTRPCMDERYKNGFEFYENDTTLEKKIFEKLHNSYIEYDLFIQNEKQVEQTKQQILQDKKDKQQKQVIEGNRQLTTSDDDEEDEEDISGQTQQQPIISFFSRQLTTREKISLKKQYINHLKDHIYTFRVKTKELLHDMKCVILRPFYQRPGSITLTSHDILFFDDLFIPANLMQEKDNIFFFKYQKRNDQLLFKVIPLQNLKEIQRRRFLGRKTALELYLMDNKTLLLNFGTTEDREQFAKKIIRHRNLQSKNLKYYDTLDPRKMLKKRELTEKWMQWKISNFEYIMQLNQLAGRSYNDLSQYPVLPWIITDNASSQIPDISFTISANQPAGSIPAPQGFRDLNKNMQLLGTAERQAEFKRKYDDIDSFASSKEKFHCGSHYSNPGIVLHFLSRLSPYIDALVELHGKGLDTPDRGFHSVQDSLNSALTDHADVRELIPEFFFCPELFQNMNKIKFGTKQDGTVVNDVRLPSWCNNDPYLFVVFLRESFESSYVSQNLCSWIDYVFGYKQKDVEAEKCLNTFSYLTYEDGIDIDNCTDQLLKQSYQEQIYNYGQTPSQLFLKNKHPQRMSRSQALKLNTVVDGQTKIKVFKPVQQQPAKSSSSTGAQQQTVLLSSEAILKAKFVDEQTIIGLSKDGTVTYFFWLSKAHELNPNTPFTCCEDKKRKFDNRQKYNGLEVYDRSIKKFDFPLLILNSQKCIMRGGFWGGKVAICPIEGISNEQQSSLTQHQSTVTSIACTLNEKIVLTGSKNGDLIVWTYIGGNSNPSHESNWQVRKHICDHEGIISNIHINEEMNMFLTCSFDGTANLYNLWNDKIYRSFQHPKLSPIHCGILSQTPLPSCCFFSREDHQWYSYSINGKLIDKQREECSHIISPQIIKDSHFMEKLVYGTEKGYLIFRQLPLLKQFKKQQVSTQYPVLSIIVSPDRRFLLVGCGDGGLNVVTEPFQLNQAVTQIQTSCLQQQPQPTQSNQNTSQSSVLSSPHISQQQQQMTSSFNNSQSGTSPIDSSTNNNTSSSFSQSTINYSLGGSSTNNTIQNRSSVLQSQLMTQQQMQNFTQFGQSNQNQSKPNQGHYYRE